MSAILKNILTIVAMVLMAAFASQVMEVVVTGQSSGNVVLQIIETIITGILDILGDLLLGLPRLILNFVLCLLHGLFGFDFGQIDA
jgi:fatty acid/phospholipid biosynthesis enzyme